MPASLQQGRRDCQ